jgi:hypothetical protein
MLAIPYAWAVMACALALVGAGPRTSATDHAPSISGKITLDGRPLPGGRIIFYMGDDQFVGAKVKADGTYKVDRIPVGKHKVTVEYKTVPPKYASEDQSALRVETKEGVNVVDFDLRSK